MLLPVPEVPDTFKLVRSIGQSMYSDSFSPNLPHMRHSLPWYNNLSGVVLKGLTSWLQEAAGIARPRRSRLFAAFASWAKGQAITVKTQAANLMKSLPLSLGFSISLNSLPRSYPYECANSHI